VLFILVTECVRTHTQHIHTQHTHIHTHTHHIGMLCQESMKFLLKDRVMHINNGHDYIFNKSTGEAGEPSNCRRTEQLWRQVQPRIIISEMRCVTVCRSEVTLVGARLLVFKALESGSNEAVMRYLWRVIAWNARSCPE